MKSNKISSYIILHKQNNKQTTNNMLCRITTISSHLIMPSLYSIRYPFSLLKFNLPDLGEKIKEGTIKKLYVKEGDKV